MSLESQQKWPAIAYDVLHNFGLNPDFRDFRARCSQYHDGFWYIGAQCTAVEADLRAWDFWRFGRWRGPAPLRAVPSDLAVSGMMLLETDPASPVAQLPSESGLTANCGLIYTTGLAAYSIEWRVYNAATGVSVCGSSPGNGVGTQSWSLPALVNGSYILWARLADVTRQLLTPGEYNALTGSTLDTAFLYTESGTQYFWDWKRNLGRLPTNPAHDLYAERRALELTGETLDRPEWAAYISSGELDGGEWSALRLQIGGGAWVAGAGVTPNPGPALYRKAVDAGLEDPVSSVAFDLLARSASALTVKRDGTLLVAGNRASRSGPQLALWSYDGGSWELLGLNPNLSNGICECALSSHDCGSVLEARDGTVYVLSKCSLHRYVASGETLLDRLPGYPSATDGEPGGQCLQEAGGALDWLTEYFGSSQTGEGNTAQFYNTRESLVLAGQGRRSGVGTVAHGPNAMTVYRGALTGVVQDKPFSDDAAKQRLAVLEGVRWNNAVPQWSAAASLLQGLESAQGVLFCYGVERESELPLAAVLEPGENGDGRLQFARFPFRVERVSKILRDGREELLILGKEVNDPEADLDAIPYSLVHLPFRMGTIWEHFCLVWNDVDRFSIVLSALPVSFLASGAPAYLRYVSDGNGPGIWAPSVSQPPEPYLAKMVTGEDLEYVLYGTQPYSFHCYDFICYTGSVPVSENWTGLFEPEPGDLNADDALPCMPDETCFTVIRHDLSCDWWALQVDDVQEVEKPLVRSLRNYPCVWLCLDKDAADDDLTAYNVRLRRANRLQNLPRTLTPEADEFIRAVYLWPPLLDGETYEVTSYSIQPRE